MQHDQTALLSVVGVGRLFGGLKAVDNLSFEVRPGEIIGLIGPNGAGKSTTFNLISGFLSPSAGAVRFGDADLRGGDVLAASKAGLVRTFQHGSYVKGMTVGDNIRLGTLARPGAQPRQARVAEAAARMGLTAHLNDRAGNLPHGLQRLVSIAIALAAAPRLLCLDEPLTGLNETEVVTVLAVLDAYRKTDGRAILLVEHNMKAVMSSCDRILVLHHGAYLASGTPKEVSANPAVIEAYLGQSHEQ
jgi:branched-chain amino acid transport system ATP-binding protein